MMSLEGREMRIGGPCDLRTAELLFHNVQGVPDSKLIIPGVFMGGELSEEVKLKPETKWRVYKGFASWFEGQLDGEILNNHWTLRNNTTAEEIFSD